METKLLEVVHCTTLSQYNACPYAYKYTPAGPIPPQTTYKGDLLNISVNGNGDMSKFMERYGKNIAYEFKDMAIMEKIFIKARDKLAGIKEKFPQYYQEAKMLHKHTDEYWIVGTPDMFFYDHEEEIWKCRDRKYSTHSWYGNEEVTKYDMQPIVYSLMIMNIMGVDKVDFAFWCYDKKTGALGEFGRVVTRMEAEEVTKKVMDAYINSKEWDEYNPRENKKCHFCSLKPSCPLYKRQVKVVSEVDDFFD